MLGLIPVRKNSARLPGKAWLELNGESLLARAIRIAKESAVFSNVVVASDDARALELAESMGVDWCPRRISDERETDAEWITQVFECRPPEPHAILRCTSPFRTAETMRRAVALLGDGGHVRAVRPVREHPGKMWRGCVGDKFVYPFLDDQLGFMRPTQSLEAGLYVQSACIEVWNARRDVFPVTPFFTDAAESVDINTPEDWAHAQLVARYGWDTK